MSLNASDAAANFDPSKSDKEEASISAERAQKEMAKWVLDFQSRVPSLASVPFEEARIEYLKFLDLGPNEQSLHMLKNGGSSTLPCSS